MEQKSVSIVLCTFNGEKYLKQQLDTLLQQTYPLLEILVFEQFIKKLKKVLFAVRKT